MGCFEAVKHSRRKMASRLQILSAWVSLAFFVCSDAQDTSNCPEYVPEGGTLDCTCLGRCQSLTDRPVLTWPGHNNTDRLVKTSISRQQDGDQFVCQMVCGSQATNTTYTLRVAYGPEVSISNVSGPLHFITDGTMVMTLTCNAATNPPPEYTWYDVSCDNNNTHSTCSFTPALGDDGKHVECQVTNPKIIPPQKATVGFNISLYYPPQSAPVISGHILGQVLQPGNTLTCTVTGGKPLVSVVSFSCNSPYHADQEDTRNQTSVSSSVTIDLHRIISVGNITCSCTASWAPSVNFYALKTEGNFSIGYLPTIMDFTVNGQSTNATFPENNVTGLSVDCQARGHPLPRMFLVKRTGDDLQILTGQETDGSQGRLLTYTMTQVVRECMGIYTCFADNGIHTQDKKAIQVNVQCSPALAEQESPHELTEAGLNFTITAYPTPGVFLFYRYTPESADIWTAVSPSNTFQVKCSRHDITSPLVKCEMTGGVLVEEDVGLYRMDVSNGLGLLQYYFRAKQTAKVDQEGTEKSKAIPVATIVGGLLGGIIFFAMAVVIAFLVWRRKYRRYEKPQPRQDPGSSPYTYLQHSNASERQVSVSYVNNSFSHLQSSTNYANTENRPDLPQVSDPDSCENVKRTNLYEQIQPRPETDPNAYDAVKTS